MNKKVNIVMLFIIVICLFFSISTIAFITRTTTTKNVITFGKVRMQLIQTTFDENNQEVDVKSDEDINITYKSAVSRIVKIKNCGNHDFFARISLDIIGIDANNQEFNANELVSYNINADDWIYKDGWYYYKKIVKQNKVSSNFFAEVDFDVDKITAKYPKGKFKFNIKAEAVQAQNNAENVLDVLGWPSE